MTKEHDQSSLNTDMIKGNLGKVLEHLAEANLSPIEIQILLATTIRSQAREKEKQADTIETIIQGKEEFAENLRELARRIEKL
jgi:hypothetical protein